MKRIVIMCLLMMSMTSVVVIGGDGNIPLTVIPARYISIIKMASEQAGVPLWVLARLLEKESSWKHDAVNKNTNGTYDLGIAQFNNAYLTDYYWFDNYGLWFDPFNPDEAIPVAARYLRRLYRVTNDWWMAVAAYECGLTRVKQDRIPEQTIRNTNRVMYGK